MQDKGFSDDMSGVCDFKCKRCGRIHRDTFEEVRKRSGGSLSKVKPPQGWEWFNSILLCESCTRALSVFMQGGSGNG